MSKIPHRRRSWIEATRYRACASQTAATGPSIRQRENKNRVVIACGFDIAHDLQRDRSAGSAISREHGNILLPVHGVCDGAHLNGS